MDDLSTKCLRNLLRPYCILSRIIGVRTFDSRSRVKSKLGLFIPFFLGVYYICQWIIAGIKTQKYKGDHEYHFVHFLYYCAFVIRCLTIVSSIVVGILGSKTWKYTVRSLDKVNKTLESLGSKTEFRRMYTRLFIELICFFVYVVIAASSFIYTIWQKTKSEDSSIFGLAMFIFSYAYGDIVEFTVTLDFLTLVRCVRSELQRANDLLNDVNILPLSSIAMELIKHEEMNNNTFKKVFTIVPVSKRLNSHLSSKRNEIFRIRRLLRTVRQIHLELYKISKNLSAFYGIQISLGMAMNIFFSTCFFFGLYTLRYTLDKLFTNELCMINVFCVFVTGKIVLVNLTCEIATKEAEKTREIIYTFYAENTDSEIKQEIKIFSMQMLHCNFSYTACGLYVLDCKHMCACIGAISIYLVIMIQMIEY